MKICDRNSELRACLLCQTAFEAGVADATREGLPRCPQCGLSETRPLLPQDAPAFVVRMNTPFRCGYRARPVRHDLE
jgi:hypothetical protein